MAYTVGEMIIKSVSMMISPVGIRYLLSLWFIQSLTRNSYCVCNLAKI